MFANKYKLLIIAGVLTYGHVQATGIVAGATEITQILNNSELIASVQKQAATVRQLSDSYIVQYRDLQQQIMAGASIGGVTLGDVTKAKSDIENYQNKLKVFGQDLSGLSNTFDRRIIEAKLLNMSSKDYLMREAQKIKNGNEVAKARVDQERAQIEQVNRDVKTIQEYGEKIPTTLGVHQSNQLLNAQMNLLLQQTSRLVTLTAQAQGSDQANKLSEEKAAESQNNAVAENLRNLAVRQREQDRTMIEKMKALP